MTALPAIKDYDLLEEIGTGGQGRVFKARQSRTRQIVAVKVLDLARDPRTRIRFHNEIQALGELRTIRGVVVIHTDAVTDDDRPVLIMEYCDRGSLASQLAEAGRFPARTALEWGASLARTLDAVHRKGLTHRDLKPSNVLMRDDESLALSDFGLALPRAEVHDASRSLLTPEHAPPERVRGERTDFDGERAGDIYSLGSTIYTLLSGAPPFGHAVETTGYALGRKIEHDPLPPIEREDVPPAAFEALQKAMAKTTGERWSTAMEQAAAFEGALAGMPLVPATPPVPTDATRPRRAWTPEQAAGSAPPTGWSQAEPLFGDPPDGDTIVRPPVGVTPVRPEGWPDPSKGQRHRNVVLAGVAGLALVGLLVVALVLPRLTSGEGADPPVPPSTTSAVTVAPRPSDLAVTEVSVLTDGSLLFGWDGSPAGGTLGYQVLLDGVRAGVGTVGYDIDGRLLREEVVLPEDLGGLADQAGRWCVQVFDVTEAGTGLLSPEGCTP